MSRTTLIRNASWAVAWQNDRHVYLTDADVAFDGPTLTFVGRGYDGPADSVIDGRDRMIMPGLVDIHSHPGLEPIHKGLTEEAGSPALYSSSLYEYLPLFRPDEAGMAAELVPLVLPVASP